jgi:hypothetical protein
MSSVTRTHSHNTSALITIFLWPFSIQSASPHESQLVEGVLGQSFLDELPERHARQTSSIVHLRHILRHSAPLSDNPVFSSAQTLQGSAFRCQMAVIRGT